MITHGSAISGDAPSGDGYHDRRAVDDNGSVQGTEGSRRFYETEVAPLLDGVVHAAGRIGRGSDVLGLDDAVSRDHDWGQRVTIVTDESTPPLPGGVELFTLDGFARDHLGLVPADDLDWLLLTGQSVLEVTAGPVFRDDIGDLTALRESLAWYPRAVEQYLVVSSWRRIDQELPLIGRTLDRGDRLGARLITARLAKAVIHLAYLRERRWPPYPKWNTALSPRGLGPLDSEAAICTALDDLAGGPVTVAFHDRPHRAIDPTFLADLPAGLPLPVGIGSVEMWCDNVDVLSHPERRAELRRWYSAQLTPDRGAAH